MHFKSQALNTQLANKLRQDEKILWCHEGAGATAFYLFYSLYGLIFLTLWCIFSGIFFLPIALAGEVISIVILLQFLMGFAGWFFCLWLLLRRKKFAYTVTDQRVFILNKFWPAGARVLGPDKVQSMERLGAPERGTIKLAGFSVKTFNTWSPEYYINLFYPAKLVNIPDPAKIEKLIYDNVATKINAAPTEKPNRKANLFHGG